MHAISRSTETGERPCIYAQLEPGVSDRFSEGDDEEEEVSAEIRLIPEDPEQCTHSCLEPSSNFCSFSQFYSTLGTLLDFQC